MPFTKVISKLLLTVLLPLFFGQAVRKCCDTRLISRFQPKFSIMGQISLIVIIFNIFCDTFLTTTKEHFSGTVIVMNTCLGNICITVALFSLLTYLHTYIFHSRNYYFSSTHLQLFFSFGDAIRCNEPTFSSFMALHYVSSRRHRLHNFLRRSQKSYIRNAHVENHV